MPVTTDRASPTCPTAIPQAPKASAAGIRFGISEISPILNERSANTRMKEMKISATVVPSSMLWILRLPIWLNMMVGLAATECMLSGRLSRSQASTRCSSSSTVLVVMLRSNTVIRVADLSMLMRSLRSSPYGSESS